MNRALIIGDVHAKLDDLADCENLIDVVRDVAEKEKPDFIVFLGDLYDSFAMKNVVVERWWMEQLLSLPRIQTFLLVGNHDRPGDATAVGHALQSHGNEYTRVVERPLVFGNFLLMPFYFKAEEFVADASKYEKTYTVFCHQSFIGGKYESGQPIEAKHDPSAVDAAVLPQRAVIGGHIHTPQHTGKVWYPGSPRWRNNVSDANIERFVYVVDFKNSLPSGVRKYPTGNACRRIWRVDVTEDQPHRGTGPGKPGDLVVVDITGPASFIEEQKKLWAGPESRIRAFQTDRPGPKLSEAEGIPTAWKKWESEYDPKFGTSREVLSAMARERLPL